MTMYSRVALAIALFAAFSAFCSAATDGEQLHAAAKQGPDTRVSSADLDFQDVVLTGGVKDPNLQRVALSDTVQSIKELTQKLWYSANVTSMLRLDRDSVVTAIQNLGSVMADKSSSAFESALSTLKALKEEADAGVGSRDRRILFLDNGETQWQRWDAASKKYQSGQSATAAEKAASKNKIATIATFLCLDKDAQGQPLKFPNAQIENAYKQACEALGKRWGVDGKVVPTAGTPMQIRRSRIGSQGGILRPGGQEHMTPIVNRRRSALLELSSSSRYRIVPFGGFHELQGCESFQKVDYSKLKSKVYQNFFASPEAFGPNVVCEAATSRVLATSIQDDFMRGERWQDMPCDGTHLDSYDPDDVDTCYVTEHHDNSTFMRSHHGAGSFWHSMTSQAVVDWLKNTKRIANPTQQDLVNAIASQAAEWVRSGVTLGSIGGRKFLDTKRFLWNLGRALHMIQDSFSCAHVVREANTLKVLYFQDFNEQSSLKHVSGGDGDGVPGDTIGATAATAYSSAIIQIALHEVDRLATGKAYIPVFPDVASRATDGIAELRAYITKKIYPFYSPKHASFKAAGCNLLSKGAPKSTCPQGLQPTETMRICPDKPARFIFEFNNT